MAHWMIKPMSTPTVHVRTFLQAGTMTPRMLGLTSSSGQQAVSGSCLIVLFLGFTPFWYDPFQQV